MFQDEARFGRINDPKRCWSPKRTRPTVGKQIIREYTYAYGAVSSRDGAADFLILPVMTAVAMKVFLDELARRHDGQYILMIYDGAPCHSPGGCESRMAVMSAAWFVEFRQRLPWLLHVD